MIEKQEYLDDSKRNLFDNFQIARDKLQDIVTAYQTRKAIEDIEMIQ